MAFVNVKCSDCGADIKIDNSQKTGVCVYCGARYIAEDNHKEADAKDGGNKRAVLEKLLIEYYAGKYGDTNRIKEYALKVQEFDINDVLANFVVFNNIDSSLSIKKLLGNSDLNIGFNLFVSLLNVCGDHVYTDIVVQNIIKYKTQIDGKIIIREINKNCNKLDLKFILNLIYNFKFTKEENDEILEELYNTENKSKITMLSQLKLFANKHKDFAYNEEKFNGYIEHWKDIKRKHLALSQSLKVKEQENNIVNEQKNQVENTYRTFENKKGIIGGIVVGVVFILFLVLLFVM